ncbi:MAG TPA: thioredoxin domain-containing protein [Polyangiaceae bacterium]|jgi:hypothetical protein|nr:thioredoxin domain-containing protein [Polyangiaceae bacterium]
MSHWRAKTAILALSVLNLNVMCNRAPAEGTKDPQAAEPGRPVKLAGVDSSALTAREQEQWSDHVSELLAPCADQPVSLAQCVREKRHCDACLPAANFLLNQVKQGKSKTQVETAFRFRFAPEEVKPIDLGNAPFEGPADAAVTVVEWADFECPFCGAAQPKLKEELEKFKPNVRLVFKNYPLASHQYAELAARAGVAAQNQGKFWEMHAKLFANQQALERKNLLRFAHELGLDEKKFVADMDSEATADVVAKDRKEAEKLGLKGTPLIIINGRRFEIEAFNLEEDLDDWLKLEVRMLTGTDVAEKAAPAASATPSSQAAAGSK